MKKWGYSLKDLLKDPAGREQFIKFLEKGNVLLNLLHNYLNVIIKTILSFHFFIKQNLVLRT